MRHSQTYSKPPSAKSGGGKMCRLMRYEVRGRKERKGRKKRSKKKRTKSGGCTWPEKKIRILHLREFRWVSGSEVFFPKNTAAGCSWARHHKPELPSRVPQKSSGGGGTHMQVSIWISAALPEKQAEKTSKTLHCVCQPATKPSKSGSQAK